VKLLDKGRPYYGCPNTQIHTYLFNRWLVSPAANHIYKCIRNILKTDNNYRVRKLYVGPTIEVKVSK